MHRSDLHENIKRLENREDVPQDIKTLIQLMSKQVDEIDIVAQILSDSDDSLLRKFGDSLFEKLWNGNSFYIDDKNK